MKISACVIVKNESKNLIEWICHHHLIGINHFIIIDDNSDDGTYELLKKLEFNIYINYQKFSQKNKGHQGQEYLRICKQFEYIFQLLNSLANSIG